MFSTAKKHWVLISASIAFVFFVVTPSLSFIKHVRTSLAPSRDHDTAVFRAPKLNVWADLSTKEAEDVVNFLFRKTNLNLTLSSLATRLAAPPTLDKQADKVNSNDNQILLVEILQPNKSDVLGYLSGSSAPPDRWARVAIVQSASDEALIVNYKV
jgi:primary-amine oxidase